MRPLFSGAGHSRFCSVVRYPFAPCLLLGEDDTMIGQAVLALLRGERLCGGLGSGWRPGRYSLAMATSTIWCCSTLGFACLMYFAGAARQLRARKDATPVLVATARDAVHDRIAGRWTPGR